ncbi:PEP-CTERM sorting domain-containing protein [Lacipirellula sp.]|uniref:PEP-CTERM sorting domain-containing protein n=1 Tax=Lacipirellula sp. TaxID=2691419 RepID=UPI003D09932C
MSITRFGFKAILLGTACAFSANVGLAAVVTQILPATPSPVVGSWYESGVQGGATIGIVDLTGAGGNLESAQPLPTGAGKIVTPNDNSARAEAYTYADFGDAASFLGNVQLAYNYYKTANPLNASAAPALKLIVNSTAGTGDNYGTLIYEPYWNGPTPTADAWQAVSISPTDGGGNDANGGWWWSGGFEIGSGAGGPPLRSLTEWVAAFQTSDPTDFATARVVALGIGEGTYNPGEVSYFDGISYTALGGGQTWNFQAVPEPASIGMAALAGVAGLALRRRACKA